MTSSAQPRRKKPGAAARAWPRWAPWAGLWGAVLALVLLAAVGPGRLLAMFSRQPQAEGPLSLTILHTNDTWGYVFPCG